MRKRLSLRKQQVAISLVKAGAPTLTARVVLVLDASGSMSRLYSTGVVKATVERMAAVSAQLDEDGSMQAWTFATHPARLPDLELAGLPEWLDLHVRVGTMFKQKPKKLRPGQLDMGKVGIGNEEQKVIAEVRDFVRGNPLRVPTLVLFFSDGGVYRNREIEQQLRDAVEEPIFWQFVGLGSAKFGILEEFDTLTGRRVDNVGFFKVKDIAQVADAGSVRPAAQRVPAVGQGRQRGRHSALIARRSTGGADADARVFAPAAVSGFRAADRDVVTTCRSRTSSAGPGHRCSCCTVIRRPTPSGIGWHRCWRSTSP